MQIAMVTVARLGVLAVAGRGFGRGRAPAPAGDRQTRLRCRMPRSRPCRCCRASRTCRPVNCTCRRRSASGRRSRRTRSRSTTSRGSLRTRCPRDWCCAPARTPRPGAARSSAASCTARTSRSRPARARAVSHHRVAPGALALLLHTPHLGSPLLVFSAKGRSLAGAGHAHVDDEEHAGRARQAAGARRARRRCGCGR